MTVPFPSPDPGRARAYHAGGQWREQTIPELIEARRNEAPDRIAVSDASGASLTYTGLDDRAAAVAGYLADRGVGAGDIVTVCLPNWCDTVTVFLAILRLGAVANPVPTTYGRADLAFVLAKCRSRALVVPGRFRSVDFTELVTSLEPAPGLPVLRIGSGARDVGTDFAEAVRHAPAQPARTASADDPAAVLFTSGTESKPKGAVHTHNTILFGERMLAGVLGIGGEDRAFMASPISHATGFLHGVVMTLTLGGTLALLDVFSGPAAVDRILREGCTWTMGATPFLADVTATLEETGARLPRLRYFMCGGAPIPEPLVRRASACGLRVMSIYGSTESPPHTVVHPDDPEDRAWTTDGRPVPGVEIGIVDERRRPVAPGEVGEARSRGPNTFIGYLGEPELSAKDLDADGWYHSGDLARVLPDGSVRIVGRLKDIIIRGGQNISVREVEDHIVAHPAVHMAAVVGVPHERLGETACAVVVLKPGGALTLADLVRFLDGRGIARFKLPERLELWPVLPTTPSGKIQKFLIRRRLAGDIAGVAS